MAPVYPDLAVKARLQGVVILECQIDVRGRVAEAKVLRGNPLLTDAAVEAVRQWVYTPTLVNGVPVPVLMVVTVTFNLDGKALTLPRAARAGRRYCRQEGRRA